MAAVLGQFVFDDLFFVFWGNTKQFPKTFAGRALLAHR